MSREILRALAKNWRIEIIRTLKSYHDREFTINELAKAAKVPTMTTWRAVKDLRKAGLVNAKRVGNAVIVKITDDREKLRALRLIPETDPQRTAALLYAKMLSEHTWLDECRLFGSIGRGEHTPGEEVDIAVVYRDGELAEEEVKATSRSVAERIRSETNVSIIPLCIPRSEMGRKGGLAAELRDKEVVWKR